MGETFDSTLQAATAAFVAGEFATASQLFMKCFRWPTTSPKPARTVRRSFPLVFLAILSESDEHNRQDLERCYEECEAHILGLQCDVDDVLDAGSLSVVLGMESRLEYVLQAVEEDRRTSETLARRISYLKQHARDSLFPPRLRKYSADLRAGE